MVQVTVSEAWVKVSLLQRAEWKETMESAISLEESLAQAIELAYLKLPRENAVAFEQALNQLKCDDSVLEMQSIFKVLLLLALSRAKHVDLH